MLRAVPFVFLFARCLFAQLTIVSAASYSNFPLAPNSIVSIFGSGFSSDATMKITDSAGNTLPIPVLSISPGQINAVLPNSTLGPGLVTVASSGAALTTPITLYPVGPAIFTADQSGGWLAAAQVVTTHADGSQSFMDSIATCGDTLQYNGMTWSKCVPVPIDLGLESDQVVLELFGTGIRGVSSVLAQCPDCGFTAILVNGYTILYAGPQASFLGLDQINVVLPQYLRGQGVTPITVTVLSGFINGTGEGADSNTVYIDVK